MFEKKSTYPIILVPGIVGYGDDNKISKICPYFGTVSASVKSIAEEEGLECYTASFKILSGVHMRACELYAQITGTTVDYGKAYASANGVARFGAKYKTAFVPGFCDADAEGNIKKITLIGHGFGVTVARYLTYLLANGSAAEREEGYDDISPLFIGGNDKAVHAVVSLAGINDGTTLFQAIEYNNDSILEKLVAVAAKLDAGIDKKSNIYPFPVDAKEYLAKTEGNVFYEAGLAGMAEINNAIGVVKDTYYICYTGEITEDYSEHLPKQKVGKSSNPFTSSSHKKVDKYLDEVELTLPSKQGLSVALTSALIGTFKNYLPDQPIVTEALHANDGFVNTDNSLAPTTEPAADYKGIENAYPGEWTQMPVEKTTHLEYIGFPVKAEVYKDFITEVLELVTNLIVDE